MKKWLVAASLEEAVSRVANFASYPTSRLRVKKSALQAGSR